MEAQLRHFSLICLYQAEQCAIMNKPVRCIDYSSVSTIVSNGFWNCDVCVVVVFVCYNFTCYCCLIDNLHTSCSGLHNKYICIQVDRAKEFFFSSLNYTIRTKCGTIYVIKKEHYNKFCHPPPTPCCFLILTHEQ